MFGILACSFPTFDDDEEGLRFFSYGHYQKIPSSRRHYLGEGKPNRLWRSDGEKKNNEKTKTDRGAISVGRKVRAERTEARVRSDRAKNTNVLGTVVIGVAHGFTPDKRRITLARCTCTVTIVAVCLFVRYVLLLLL